MRISSGKGSISAAFWILSSPDTETGNSISPGRCFGGRDRNSEAELQTFLNGYRQFGTCDAEAVKTYMAQCYVYFLQFCGDDAEYCAYIRARLQAFANEKRGRRTD